MAICLGNICHDEFLQCQFAQGPRFDFSTDGIRFMNDIQLCDFLILTVAQAAQNSRIRHNIFLHLIHDQAEYFCFDAFVHNAFISFAEDIFADR